MKKWQNKKHTMQAFFFKISFCVKWNGKLFKGKTIQSNSISNTQCNVLCWQTLKDLFDLLTTCNRTHWLDLCSSILVGWLVEFMVFNATFNNISVISWRSVLLVEETTDQPQVTDKLYHKMLYTSPWVEVEPVIGTDCLG